MKEKSFSQDEVNKILSIRLKREREKLTKEFESKLRRRVTAIQRTLQELCVIQQDDGQQKSETQGGELQ